MTKFWVGTAPITCDQCHAPIDFTFYDVSVPRWRGMWGAVCGSCFNMLGCKLGIGHGQQYQRMPDGRYACMKGGTLDYGRKADTTSDDNAETL